MDENQIKTIAAAGVVVGVLCVHNWRINRLKKMYWGIAEILQNHMDIDFQRDVDEAFIRIMEHYEE